MNVWRSFVGSYKSISWLLIAALLCALLLPSHFHLHHAEHAVEHGHGHHHAVAEMHVIDLHLLNRSATMSHHLEDTHVITLNSEGFLIGKLVDHPVFIYLVIMLALLPVFARFLQQHGSVLTGSIWQTRYCTSPPLRAPPAP